MSTKKRLYTDNSLLSMTTESWNKRYATSKNLFGISPNKFLVANAALFKPGMSALAIGDGEGHNGIWLAQQGLQVESVDLSNVAQEKARALAEKASVSINTVCSDILAHLDNGKKYDIIAHFFVHLPASSKQELHKKIINSLNPGGYFLFECFHKEHHQNEAVGPKDIDMLYDEEEIRADFSRLKNITLQKQMTDAYEETLGSQAGVSLTFLGRAHF